MCRCWSLCSEGSQHDPNHLKANLPRSSLDCEHAADLWSNEISILNVLISSPTPKHLKQMIHSTIHHTLKKIICKVCWDKTLPAYPSCPSSLVRRECPEKIKTRERRAEEVEWKTKQKEERKGFEEDRKGKKRRRKIKTLCKNAYQKQNMTHLGITDWSPKHTIKKP